jgi:hypothetical protein
MNRRRAAIAAVAASVLAFGTAAIAAPTVSMLQLTPAGTINVTFPGSTNVSVALDPATCPAALDGGLSYNAIASTANSATATVGIGAPSTGIHCDGSISFTVTATGCGDTTATFTPVAYNKNGKLVPGANKKLAGTTVGVHVTGDGCVIGGNEVPPPAGTNPAAPAVANQYINEQLGTDYAAFTCANGGYKKAGKLWRGALIKDVAAWMPRPESVKDNTAIFATSGDWVDFVVSEVDSLCASTGNIPFFPALAAVAH